MTNLENRRYAFLAGMLAVVACWGLNRLIAGPQADSWLRTAAILAQIVVGAGASWWCWQRSAGKGTARALDPTV
jgi:hypothetical protein